MNRIEARRALSDDRFAFWDSFFQQYRLDGYDIDAAEQIATANYEAMNSKLAGGGDGSGNGNPDSGG